MSKVRVIDYTHTMDLRSKDLYDVWREAYDYIKIPKNVRELTGLADPDRSFGYINVLSGDEIKVFTGRKCFMVYKNGSLIWSPEKLNLDFLQGLVEELSEEMTLKQACDSFFSRVVGKFKTNRASDDILMVRLPKKNLYFALVALHGDILPVLLSDDRALGGEAIGELEEKPSLRDDPAKLVKILEDLDSA